MSKAGIKEKLIDQINSIEDEKLLKEIYALINLEQELHDEEVYMLTAEQKKSLLKSYDDVKKGNFLTNNQANEEAGGWLKD